MVFSGLEGAPAELVKTAKNEVQLAVKGNLGQLRGQICQSDAQILLEMHHTVRAILKRLVAPQEDTAALTQASSHLAGDIMSQYSQITVESIYAAGFGMKLSPPTRMQIQNSKVRGYPVWYLVFLHSTHISLRTQRPGPLHQSPLMLMHWAFLAQLSVSQKITQILLMWMMAMLVLLPLAPNSN
jgi:hypothetical protein